MLHSLSSQLFRFIKGEKGGVLVFVGLCLIPLLLIMGLAVDSSMGMQQKRLLQAAVDAAAKAGAANGNSVVATTTSEAQKIFSINAANLKNVSGPTINVNTSNKTVTVSASINVLNTFMGIGGAGNSTYSASATASLPSDNIAEVAIVYEVSGRFANNNFHQNICNALISFVNSLPSNVMVSITPIATEFLLDSTTTVSDNLFSLLSTTTNDEYASPGFYPLGPSNTWNLTTFNAVTSPYYYSKGSYASFPTEPLVVMSNLSPSTCKIPVPNYPSCSSVTWPTKCPGTNNTSCSQVYSYIANPSYPVLPLTLNKTLIVNYLNGLKAFTAQADGLFPSLISWGWRTIDPNWNNLWLTNSDASSTLRSFGQYPKPYGGTRKSMILIFNSTAYWNDYTSNVAAYYVNKCGDATTVVNGLNHWWMTGYGMVPVPTDWQSKVNDITCENRWYKTMDKSLGLNLSDNTNYNATVDTSTFKTNILSEVSAKFFRICNNIKANNIDIYLLANSNTGTLSPCCNASTNAYTIGNSSTSISTALSDIKTKIAAKTS